MISKPPISVAYGDGIGPEIMQATLKILAAAGAALEIEAIEVGKNVYLQGFTSGISEPAWESLRRTKILLKGPITTPQGGGYKSLNVTLRKALGLFANVRPCASYAPYVKTLFPDVNLVIIRENEEDMYAGIEYRETQDTIECLKLVSRQGCEHIIQYAFAYARKFNRKKVTCFTKDNIMKMSDGLFHRTFNEIAASYPDIEHDHFIIDIGAALLATKPQAFDVIVTLNLYGDIISDIAAQITGSVGLGGSANIGNQMAMFEAIHGSAPDIAGLDIANPSGLLNAAVQLLMHIGQAPVATLIENAWLKTLEDGIHTKDIGSSVYTKKIVGTEAFGEAVIARLGQTPSHFSAVNYQNQQEKIFCYDLPVAATEKKLIGVDIYIDHSPDAPIEELAEKLLPLSTVLHLIVINNRGLKVWPKTYKIESSAHYYCCRFQTSEEIAKMPAAKFEDVLNLLKEMHKLKLEIVKVQNLYLFDQQIGFSLAQGQ